MIKWFCSIKHCRERREMGERDDVRGGGEARVTADRKKKVKDDTQTGNRNIIPP